MTTHVPPTAQRLSDARILQGGWWTAASAVQLPALLATLRRLDLLIDLPLLNTEPKFLALNAGSNVVRSHLVPPANLVPFDVAQLSGQAIPPSPPTPAHFPAGLSLGALVRVSLFGLGYPGRINRISYCVNVEAPCYRVQYACDGQLLEGEFFADELTPVLGGQLP